MLLYEVSLALLQKKKVLKNNDCFFEKIVFYNLFCLFYEKMKPFTVLKSNHLIAVNHYRKRVKKSKSYLKIAIQSNRIVLSEL